MTAAVVASGPQLLDAETLALKSGGWYLPQGTSRWTSVIDHPPGLAVGARCWWSPTEPPGGGWWLARSQSSNI